MKISVYKSNVIPKKCQCRYNLKQGNSSTNYNSDLVKTYYKETSMQKVFGNS